MAAHPVLLPENPHGQQSLVAYSPKGRRETTALNNAGAAPL